MSRFKIKGIGWRCDNAFYVDIHPSRAMRNALFDVLEELQEQTKDPLYDCGMSFLNLAYDINSPNDKPNLSTWVPEFSWIDIPYKCSENEVNQIIDFINKWKDKLPENPYGEEYDEDEYGYAIPDDIPWKEEVLR
jgi:hypothetical protein